MSVTISNVQQVGRYTWRVTWSSQDSPTYYVYRDGRLVATTPQTTMSFVLQPGDRLSLEVFDVSSDRPAGAFPDRLTLGWYQVTGAAYYRIDEYYGAEWVERVRVTADQWYHTWTSRVLEDLTTHQFRIVPVDAAGNEGSATTRSALMVRHPDPPTASYAYDNGTGKVTVTVA